MKKLRITVNGVAYEVDVEVLEDDDEGGTPYGFPSRTSMPTTSPSPSRPAAPAASAPAAAPAAKPAPSSGGGDTKTLTSPIAGIIVEIKASVGASVKENDPVVIIEAMKMNTNISSPVSGTVKSIEVKPGEGVKQGQLLMTFE